MGICPISNSFKTVPAVEPDEPFVKCRFELINRLRKLHKLNLQCKRLIEDYIVTDKREDAIVLKSKQLDLKDCSKVIQKMLRSLDEADEEVKGNFNRCLYSGDMMKIANDLEKQHGLSELTEFLESCTVNEDTSLDSTFSECRIDRKEEVLVRLKVHSDKLESLNKNSMHQRKSYAKRLNS